MKSSLLDYATVTLVVTAVGVTALYFMAAPIIQMFVSITRILP